ncbi:YggS family pyridoxal phosphate enzyme [Bordetella trematum]|uniref:Pyridoxal phosphate homeostasis protein n=1 Tax=Bordetella trematum TaxID=123899 RepID=A0A157SE55_9BORD|nr:YggS family pyridoxal phosphate-dependent enzyme [Bordetella trematum]AUL45721.1 YggS family pyridoxal phosphate enzyme [Bordetella trematum]AZR92514.1 YggS family pyridoxal phosphate enzyme [Bordetella trematum]NNH20282.1 YggS family pyridoxal phosphate-dependent enzyme [Bordetella trematum]QIM71093.1 YggS family pyridoxal phosphate-dependent enzyme [Bordetella trematum]SAI56393.1 Predicted enzyme with a TIM-barrel fold [Bordetella trematum]
MTDSMASRLAAIEHRISQACQRAGRAPGSVALLPVSKTFDARAVREAAALGLRRFGENKTQEIRQKADPLADLGLSWVMIGHLQTNKAKDVARDVAEVQSLDRADLADALQRRLHDAGRSLDVLVQIKTSPEPSKFGLDPEALPQMLAHLQQHCPALRVQGLMTMAVNSDDPAAVRACFRRLRELRERHATAALPLARLSMGMSGDFEIAIEEGSTEVRIGSALFGARSYPA